MSPDGRTQPVWSSDGDYIFYNEGARGIAGLMAVPVTRNGHDLQFGRPIQITDKLAGMTDARNHFTPHPDGSRFLVRTLDEVARTWKIPSKYSGYEEPDAARLKSNIQVIFDELK